MNQKYVLCETYHNVNQLPRFFGTLEEARSAMVDQFNRYVNHSLPNDYDCKDTLAYCVSRYGGCKCRWDIFTVDFDNPNIVLTIDDGLPDIRFDSIEAWLSNARVAYVRNHLLGRLSSEYDVSLDTLEESSAATTAAKAYIDAVDRGTSLEEAWKEACKAAADVLDNT